MNRILDVTRCWTGRFWFNIGSGFFAVGFGPRYFIERVFVLRKMVYPRPSASR